MILPCAGHHAGLLLVSEKLRKGIKWMTYIIDPPNMRVWHMLWSIKCTPPPFRVYANLQRLYIRTNHRHFIILSGFFFGLMNIYQVKSCWNEVQCSAGPMVWNYSVTHWPTVDSRIIQLTCDFAIASHTTCIRNWYYHVSIFCCIMD